MKALFLSLLFPSVLSAAELKDVRSVYLYPMLGGLDQHLANRLTNDHVFRVVADPKLADAVFTDQLGKQLEYRLEHIKRNAVPVPATSGAPNTAAQSAGQPMASAVNSAEAEPHSSSFSRGKGTLFLVDAKSRQVVWSEYRLPRNSSPGELDKTAKRVAAQITKTLSPAAVTPK